MKSKTKVWLGLGICVATGAATALPVTVAARTPDAMRNMRNVGLPTLPPVQGGWLIAQHAHDGGEAGEAGVPADLPPDFLMALTVALIRGHLLVGDELVKAGLWDAGLPHFLHPTEELYGGIADKLADYKTQPFDQLLLALADAVKQKNADAYTAAMAKVLAALDSADAAVKAKQADWPSFAVATAIMAMKAAGGEYGEAIVKGRIAKPVEYQDSRGFVWQAERMIEGVGDALAAKNPAALKAVRAAIKELKRTWPTAVPPKTPVKSAAAVMNDISRVQRAAAGLM